MCGQFWWTLESRNPLAPWLYQAFSPLIFLLPEGLYLLRKLVDLFLATSVYLLVDKISHARLPKFAFACGVLVLFWNFSGYFEQIMWIPLVAFGLSMLSVYFTAVTWIQAEPRLTTWLSAFCFFSWLWRPTQFNAAFPSPCFCWVCSVDRRRPEAGACLQQCPFLIWTWCWCWRSSVLWSRPLPCWRQSRRVGSPVPDRAWSNKVFSPFFICRFCSS
jgi:hypothetical protein